MEPYSVFKRAISAHQNSDFDNALKNYSTLLDDKDLFRKLAPKNQEACLLNSTSLMRKFKNNHEAIKLLNDYLLPDCDLSIDFRSSAYNNIGNNYLDLKKYDLAQIFFRKCLLLDPLCVESRLSLAKSLGLLGHHNLAYKVLRDGILLFQSSKDSLRFLQPLANSLISLKDKFSTDDTSLERFVYLLESSLPYLMKNPDCDEASVNCKIFLAQFYIGLSQLDKALMYRDETSQLLKSIASQSPLNNKFLENWNALGWNLAIHLLKAGDLANGWRLYDYGLRVPTGTKQKWQRALRKPFSFNELPIWRGEPLQSKHLLVLGEQGIGDSMMFFTLIPALVSEGCTVSIYVEERLRSIYKRSMPSVNILDEAQISTLYNHQLPFDYQVPAGSICQYRFTEFSAYPKHTPLLLSMPSLTKRFRDRHYDGRPLVGISWQGGGKKNIIDQKTVPLKLFKKIVSNDSFKFVSLQYGHDEPHIQKFNNNYLCDLVHDDDVDCMIDMDTWLSQVDAMDYVLSVANTTIHGAGGLGKPTLCLLGNQSDWRWTDQEVYSGSYWYPTVEVALRSSDSSWDEALEFAYSWLLSKL